MGGHGPVTLYAITHGFPCLSLCSLATPLLTCTSQPRQRPPNQPPTHQSPLLLSPVALPPPCRPPCSCRPCCPCSLTSRSSAATPGGTGGGLVLTVAVKRLKPEVLSSPSDLKDFLMEVNIMRKLRHP